MIKQRLKEYAPAITGILLIAVGFVLPLGTLGAPRLIDLMIQWGSELMRTF